MVKSLIFGIAVAMLVIAFLVPNLVLISSSNGFSIFGFKTGASFTIDTSDLFLGAAIVSFIVALVLWWKEA